MNRRESIRTLALGSGLLLNLPAWAEHWSAASLPVTKASAFDAGQQALIASIADTIIPAAGDTPGALAVGVDKFLFKLISDCYEPAVAENVKRCLGELDAASGKQLSKPFSTCDQKQKEALILQFSSSSKKEDQDFFNLMKSETIRGYNTSKEVMLKYLKYKIAPGHYYGCVDVNG